MVAARAGRVWDPFMPQHHIKETRRRGNPCALSSPQTSVV